VGIDNKIHHIAAIGRIGYSENPSPHLNRIQDPPLKSWYNSRYNIL